MTEKLYLADARLLACSAVVTAVRCLEGGRWAIRLDRTIFHPQGGGQKTDRGRIGTAHVLHVAHDGPEVDHMIDSAVAIYVGATVALEVEQDWRAFNTAFHTAGHLLAGVVEQMYPGTRAISGHQWPGEARVEFESTLSKEQFGIDAINHALTEALRQAWSVRLVGAPYSDRGVQIGDFQPIPCGGTHVGNLREIDHVQVDAVKFNSGKVRMSYSATPTLLSSRAAS